MQLLGSSFPKERLLTTDPAIRVWWACHSKPPLPCNGTLGVWWVVGGTSGMVAKWEERWAWRGLFHTSVFTALLCDLGEPCNLSEHAFFSL